MICHLLSELKFCFDKHWEKNSFLCEDEYLPHIKLHCSSIAGKDLQSWRQAFPIVVLARLRLASREQSVASNRNHHTTVLLQRQSSNAWTTAPSQAFSQSEIIWLTWMARALRARRRVGRAWLPVHMQWQGFKFIILAKTTVTPGRQLQVRLATSPRSYAWHAQPQRACCQWTCSGRVSNLKPWFF